MEKLEAALAKAREMRRSALSATPPVRDRAGARDRSVNDWLTLPEISLTPEAITRGRISALAGGRDATPYDLLRSRTYRLMKEKGWSRLAITSPGTACGKTTIALNLALSLARQRDLRVMLLDFDLRRPSLHRMLGHVPENSFHEVLEGRVAFAEQAMRIGSNLAIALNTSKSLDPSELMQSAATRRTLDEIERNWQPDLMIFDLAPMDAGDDYVNFLGNVDCALLVAAAESTTLANIDICEKELAQLTDVLGIVLNKCRYSDDSVGYNYEAYG
ncbi:CpsD/CapB family tyrosine-protein kinase [Defluviimonas sp. D31]|uniref:tyrosine-protein kinase family protein n=1 Tax=Defluviimonas sp. D31 TaxID=3083253 RepID=UPI00296FC2F6|nr:CpsD/CapB family tyrosine-protein kinase [Defluviimonas sp. D31]MDW4550094.1 CpsD/CapB family tyrosine-protein kinase [Defluviimonas sp. D31]